MKTNKLAINANKTNELVISPKMKESMINISFTCDESPISIHQNVKYNI